MRSTQKNTTQIGKMKFFLVNIINYEILILFYSFLVLTYVYLIGWLQQAPETFVGRGEAFCKLYRVPLRAHKTDLMKNSNINTHKHKANSINITKQSALSSFGKLNFNEKKKCNFLKSNDYYNLGIIVKTDTEKIEILN